MTEKIYQVKPPRPFEDPPRPAATHLTTTGELIINELIPPPRWYDRLISRIDDRVMAVFNHRKTNAAVGLIILAVAFFFAGAIFAHFAWPTQPVIGV